MFKHSRRLILALACLLVALALVACNSGAEVTLPPVSGTPGMSVLITESDCPYIDSIKVNDMVIWTNADKIAHQIHIEYEDGETMGDIGPLQPGDTVSWTFPEAGSFPYSCTAGEEPSASITVVP
jgi:hypothetical protein